MSWEVDGRRGFKPHPWLVAGNADLNGHSTTARQSKHDVKNNNDNDKIMMNDLYIAMSAHAARIQMVPAGMVR